MHSKICHQQNNDATVSRRILEILKFGAMTCETESHVVVCIELNNDLGSYRPRVGSDRSMFQSFSGFFPSYKNDLWATCLFRCSPSQVCILMNRKQVRTSINDKSHVLVKRHIYNGIDKTMCNLYFIVAPTSGSKYVRVSQL